MSLVLNSIADRLDELAILVRSPRLAAALNSVVGKASTVVAALFIVLRYWAARSKKARTSKRSFITDSAHVGRPVEQAELYEYDVIVVGGGT